MHTEAKPPNVQPASAKFSTYCTNYHKGTESLGWPSVPLDVLPLDSERCGTSLHPMPLSRPGDVIPKGLAAPAGTCNILLAVVARGLFVSGVIWGVFVQRTRLG